LDEALKIFKSLSLKNENVLNNIAVIYIEKKNYEKAENYLKKALDINPSFEDAVFNLGICYFETKNWTKLIKLCEKYENTFKNQKDNILTIEAYSYYRLRKFEKSKKIFKIINKEKLDKDVKTLYKMLFNKLRLIYGL
jgi:tetratricopeptide (TPR) repeat protein